MKAEEILVIKPKAADHIRDILFSDKENAVLVELTNDKAAELKKALDSIQSR